MTINFSTTGTATAGDFTASDTGTVSFAAGSSTATVTVDPTADATVEPDETVVLTVTAGTDYNIGHRPVPPGRSAMTISARSPWM